jgi:hypothetical protein
MSMVKALHRAALRHYIGLFKALHRSAHGIAYVCLRHYIGLLKVLRRSAQDIT